MQVSNFTLSVKSQPRAEGPELLKDGWTFQCLDFKLDGTVLLGESAPTHKVALVKEPSRSPVGMGWRAGWIQVNVQEWYWALYRSSGGDGAWLLNWPGYEAIDNADREGTDLFYKLDPPFYQQLSRSSPLAGLSFLDMPIAAFEPTLKDPGGGQSVLASIGVRLSFVCALAVRDPDDAVYATQWVPWYVQWLCDFRQVASALQPQRRPEGTKACCGLAQFGAPPILKRAVAASWGGRTANAAATFGKPVIRQLRGNQIDAELARLRGA